MKYLQTNNQSIGQQKDYDLIEMVKDEIYLLNPLSPSVD